MTRCVGRSSGLGCSPAIRSMSIFAISRPRAWTGWWTVVSAGSVLRAMGKSSALAAIGLTAGLTCAPAAHATVQATDPVTMTNGFYVNPNNSAAVWSAANPTDGREPATGAYVGAAAYWDQLPVLVAYNIPDRDICAGQSSGGAASDAAYDSWINLFAVGIADRPAAVILEPDALADESCMTSAEISDRDGLLNNAITQFTDQAPETWVYLDAGNPGWIPAATMAGYLNSAGLSQAHGFSLNVSSFYTVAQNVAYGYTKPFVIDTSRDGNGSNDNQWCNPASMKLGPTDQVGLTQTHPGHSSRRHGRSGPRTAGPKPRHARVAATALVRTLTPVPARPAAAGGDAVSAAATPGSMRPTPLDWTPLQLIPLTGSGPYFGCGAAR
jgi:endoglucanase